MRVLLEVTVAWEGGEPTMMGVDFFRRSVELAEKQWKHCHGSEGTSA